MAKRREVQAITSVGRALSSDVHDRTVRYLVAMAIRTACVVGAFVADGWLRWVMVAGAIVLPYFAVVMANAGRERPTQADTMLDQPELESRPQRPGTVHIDLRGGYLR